MSISMKTYLALAASFAAGPVAAQNSDWTYAASVYGWFVGTDVSVDTQFGILDAGQSASDNLDSLSMAFMGTFEARRGQWGFIGDLVYADLSETEETPRGLVFSKLNAEVKVTAFSGYATYRVHETEQFAFDLAGGFRAFAVDLDASLDSAGRAQDRSFSASESWVVPLVGARVIVPFSDTWFATAYADVGGLSGDNSTWQAFASVGYKFNSRWSAQLAYRYMSIDKEINGKDANIDLYGPVLGVTARF